MAKADNMLAILWLLRAQRRLTAAKMAEELEISERTVYRYIDSLCASGVPIIAELGPEGGYRLAENFQGAPLFFEPTELNAIFHAAQFAAEAGYPHSQALESATTKIRQNLTPEQIERTRRHTAAFRAIRQPRGGDVQPWLAHLEQAVAETERVLITYQKPEQSEAEERIIDPYGVVHSAGLWYMVGFCHQRQAIRQFRVDRVSTVWPTGERFERPADFRLEEYFSDEWIQRRQRSIAVHLEGEPWVLAALAEHWYLRYCLVERAPQTLHLQVDQRGLAELPAILLQYGRKVSVRAPSYLRQSLVELAQEWLEHHASTKD